MFFTAGERGEELRVRFASAAGLITFGAWSSFVLAPSAMQDI